MTAPPPRKRFQIHLSTAIVMMFVAGGLIWANFTPVRATPGGIAIYGWPVIAVVGYYENTEFQYKELFVDIWIAFSILYITWRLCEYLIRRRAAQKGA